MEKITVEQLKAVTGMTSFFEAYQWLRAVGQQDAEHMGGGGQQATKPSEMIRLSIPQIKAQALDEIYLRLPTDGEFSQALSRGLHGGNTDELAHIYRTLPKRL